MFALIVKHFPARYWRCASITLCGQCTFPHSAFSNPQKKKTTVFFFYFFPNAVIFAAIHFP